MPTKFQQQVDSAFDELEGEVMDVITSAVERGLTSLENNSPIWSGYYQANHRVSINDPDVELNPNKRSAAGNENVTNGEGHLAVSGLAKREKPKLEEAKLGDIIYIGNAVEYSNIIEQGTKKNPAGGFYSQASIVISGNIENN